MHPALCLYEDTLSNAADQIELPPSPRMIFVVHGTATIDGRLLRDGEVWHGTGPAMLTPGDTGVSLWRWEIFKDEIGHMLAGPGIVSREKLSVRLTTLPEGELLWRGDSVAFPPGGCAFLHTHQGPGIRCLLEGGIRIDTQGHSTSYGPGGAWFESGPDPVFAQAAPDRNSRFIRVLVLPRALRGQSSLLLVNDSDRRKPRAQRYEIFADAPIDLPA